MAVVALVLRSATANAAVDLWVSGMSISPTSMLPGGAATLAWHLRNSGANDPGTVFYRVVFSSDSVITIADTTLVSGSKGAIGPNADVPMSTPLTIPANAVAGTRYVGVILDPNNNIAETSESNNTGRATITVLSPPFIDLQATSITVSPVSPSVGQQVSISGVITNAGNTQSPAFNWTLAVDGSPCDSGRPAFLGAGGSITSSSISCTWTFNTTGTHRVDLIADTGNEVAESSETNNDRTVNPSVSPPPQPDLQATSITVSPAAPQVGQLVTVTGVITNAGNADAGAFSWTLAIDGNVCDSGRPAFLSAGGSITAASISCNWTFATTGTHRADLIADTGNEIAESSETNNDLTVNPNVTPPPQPDLQATSITITPTAPHLGQIVTVTGVITNVGNADAGSFSWTLAIDGNACDSGRPAFLSAGGSITAASISCDWTFATTGTHRADLIADTASEIAETSETNNSLRQNVSVGLAPSPCLIFVHGTIQDDFSFENSLFRDDFEKGSIVNWSLPGSGIEPDWPTAFQYWQEDFWEATVPSFLVAATEGGQRSRFVVRWNGAQAYDDVDAAQRVAREILRATNGEYDRLDGTADRSCCTEAYPNGRFWVIAHSGGANVMDFILGNSRPSDPYPNLNGAPFDLVAQRVERVITVGGAHRGSELANLVCPAHAASLGITVDGSASACFLGTTQLCTEARLWLRTDPVYQVSGRTGPPAVPVWLVGGSDDPQAFCANELGGEDDTVLSFETQFACATIGSDYVESNVCGAAQKMYPNFFNLDAGDETHADEKNNEDGLGERGRSQVPEGIYRCGGVACNAGTQQCQDLSTANLVRFLADPDHTGFAGAANDNCAGTVGVTAFAVPTPALEVSAEGGRVTSFALAGDPGDSTDPVASHYQPPRYRWSDGSRAFTVTPSAAILAPGDTVEFEVEERLAADSPRTPKRGTWELLVGGRRALLDSQKAEPAGKAGGLIRSKTARIPIDDLAADDTGLIRFELLSIEGEVLISGILERNSPIARAVSIDRVWSNEVGIFASVRVESTVGAPVFVQAVLYDRDHPVSMSQANIELRRGENALELFFGWITVPAGTTGLRLRHVSLGEIKPHRIQRDPLRVLDAPVGHGLTDFSKARDR